MVDVVNTGTGNEQKDASPIWEAPPAEHVGTRGEWPLPDGRTVAGVYLAFWTSRFQHRSGTWAEHNHGGEFVPEGRHCQACRWFEMSLWRDDDGRYVLVRHNVSDVPGETDRMSVARVERPLDLVLLPGLGPDSRPLAFLLRSAAVNDEAIRDLGM